MKNLLKTIALIAIFATICSCSKDDKPGKTDPSKGVQFSITSDGGTSVNFTTREMTSSGSYSDFSASTGTPTAESFVAMNIKTENCTTKEPGDELEITSFAFCKPLSSNSEDYTTKFSGKIYIISNAKTAGMVTTIRFNNLKCTISGTEYTLNGDLQYKRY